MRQVDAVINAVKEVKPDFEFGVDIGLKVISGELRKQVCAIVTAGLADGTIDYGKDRSDSSAVKKYANNVVNNWLRKNKKLNGNSNYEIKNPGSRATGGDKELKALKAARKLHGDDPETAAEIDRHIERRRAEIAAEKAKDEALTEEQLDALPAELRAALNI